ncbi:hypothetical protein [Chlorogloeopsis sp. ULAP02]|uniref:hypothetical protein n=1 Tax=Chlorogloeopsis sp. ULAP02 TaxID=3107926 RepID=UPI003135265E
MRGAKTGGIFQISERQSVWKNFFRRWCFGFELAIAQRVQIAVSGAMPLGLSL